MSGNVLFIGLDVDDKSFHGCALAADGKQSREFKLRPTTASLTKKLLDLKREFGVAEIRVCYEATYIGYTLQRALSECGFVCEVVAPTSIPRTNGNSVKTDRIDARKLAQYYAKGLLSIVTVPDKEQEEVRDLLRTRHYILQQLSEMRSHIQALLRRHGRHFRAESTSKTHWTPHHLCWLDRVAVESTGSFGTSLKLLVQQMKWLVHTLGEYDKAVDELAEKPKYQKKVQALTVYKGIKNIWAMVLISEIGDIQRFSHPAQLASWAGLDIREYSSGGNSNRFGITKHGNKFVRTALVEINQKGFRSTTISGALKTRRKNAPPEIIGIADRCHKRLYKKSFRLLMGGKHPNKVKVACAREMVGFIWESLRAAS
jgi:transposase